MNTIRESGDILPEDEANKILACNIKYGSWILYGTLIDSIKVIRSGKVRETVVFIGDYDTKQEAEQYCKEIEEVTDKYSEFLLITPIGERQYL